MALEWNVIVHDINQDRIRVYNVFSHSGFVNDITKYVKQRKTREEFSELVRKSLMYYFWSKCEWEILIKPLCGSRNNDEEKVDVYWQIMTNWERFIDYLWENRKSMMQLGR